VHYKRRHGFNVHYTRHCTGQL